MLTSKRRRGEFPLHTSQAKQAQSEGANLFLYAYGLAAPLLLMGPEKSEGKE